MTKWQQRYLTMVVRGFVRLPPDLRRWLLSRLHADAVRLDAPKVA